MSYNSLHNFRTMFWDVSSSIYTVSPLAFPPELQGCGFVVMVARPSGRGQGSFRRLVQKFIHNSILYRGVWYNLWERNPDWDFSSHLFDNYGLFMARGCSDMFIVFPGPWLNLPKFLMFETLKTPVVCTYPLTLLYILLLLSQSDWCLHSNDILITFAFVFVGLNIISLSMSAFDRM